jgi:lactoylglutathione lyase
MKSALSFYLFSILLLTFSHQAYPQSSRPSVRINHVAIFVRDIKTTKNFYENIIGLDTIPEPFHDGKHAWYTLGSAISMHVIQGATEKKEYYKNQHNCFSVPSVDDFTKVLAKNNIVWEDVRGTRNAISTRVDGIKQIWLQDPDGYWIEINDVKD